MNNQTRIDMWKVDLEHVADLMADLGKDMQTHGGFNKEIVAKGKELVGASTMALMWLAEDWNE